MNGWATSISTTQSTSTPSNISSRPSDRDYMKTLHQLARIDKRQGYTLDWNSQNKVRLVSLSPSSILEV
jgi:hypothetical protein